MSGEVFGPGAILTPANAVTLARIALAPVAFAMMLETPHQSSWPLVGVWFVLSTSDLLDGRLARRYGTTRSGAFLDPLADKVLVLGAMFTLVSRDVFWVVPVVIIAGREIAISLYRTFVGAKGVSVPASKVAKWKTLTQQLAVGFAIMPWIAVHARWLWNGFLWLSVALALISGTQYLVHARRGVVPAENAGVGAP